MKVIINNLILAINNLAAAINKKNSSHTTTSNPYYTYPSTSNPYSSNVKVTSYYQKDLSANISAEEYDALEAVYKALTDKGSYPKHHDHVARELKVKWPTLNKALDQLVKARNSKRNPSTNTIWKETK